MAADPKAPATSEADPPPPPEPQEAALPATTEAEPEAAPTDGPQVVQVEREVDGKTQTVDVELSPVRPKLDEKQSALTVAEANAWRERAHQRLYRGTRQGTAQHSAAKADLELATEAVRNAREHRRF